ncbi:glycohydrolase toxin TNT-related protein [Ornithinimicrobium tianjinense]|uniref:TNT domain-containing protein n=1 Tax=Ornithinimicrobium tianjinense TaxID=1195761 RepID=A0A917BU90_9MICO|nr:glycohydrolase toxin TNT-related protein [Ornithinimicrobium tianjinense]GGF58926.1 hypothetical protein GCM10011366_28450 [Ornithinimicrobium tianjinense]
MSTVHIDHRALHGVNADLRRVVSSVDEHVRALRSDLVRLGVPTHHLDAALGAKADLAADVLPALRGREREAERIASLPSSGALRDSLARRELRVDEQPARPEETSISALTGGSVPPAAPTQFVPEQPAEPEPDEPPLLSVGGLRRLGGDILGGIRDGAEWLAGQISDAWDTLAEEVSKAWEAMASWWDETSGQLGAWIDENLAEVREWIKNNVIILRIVAIVLKVVGWILVVVGAVLLILAVIASLTGVGALAGVPGAGVALAIMSGGAALVGAGEMVDTIADWGEGKIDGQQLVQQLAGEALLTAVTSVIPGGAILRVAKKALQGLLPRLRRQLDDFFRGLGPGSGPGSSRPPRGPHVDIDELPAWMQPKPVDRTGPDGHLYPDGFNPYGSLSEQEFYDTYVNAQGGGWRYPPDDGFAGPRMPSTLEPGDVIDRFGSPQGGYFAAPEGVPFDQRALPPSSINYSYGRYRVVRPLDGVTEGEIAPWFEQPGGGLQYHFPEPRDIQWYIDNGYLVEIESP